MAEDPDVAGPPVGERPPGRRSPVAGGLYAFGRFWREFLIGDTPELFIGAVAVIAALKGEDFGIPLQFNNFRD